MADRLGSDSLDVVERIMSLDELLEDLETVFGVRPAIDDVIPDPEFADLTFGRLYDLVLAQLLVDRSDLNAPLTAKVFIRLRNAISSITGKMGLDHSIALTSLVDSHELADFWQQIEVQTALRLPPLQRHWLSLRADYLLPWGVSTLGDLADNTTAANLGRLVERDIGYRPDDVWAVLAALVRRHLRISGAITRATRLE